MLVGKIPTDPYLNDDEFNGEDGGGVGCSLAAGLLLVVGLVESCAGFCWPVPPPGLPLFFRCRFFLPVDPKASTVACGATGVLGAAASLR